jgi:hypothetical protein
MERMNVMKRACKQDCVKIAIIKIRPFSDARIYTQLPRGSNGPRIAVNGDDGVSIPR